MADYKLPIITGTSLTTGDLLRWNGSNWVNYSDSNYDHYVDRGDPSVEDFRGNKESGAATATSADHLVDTNATFETNGVAIGDHVHNTTDDTWAAVTAINSQTDLTLDTDIMVDTDVYYVGSFKTDGGTYELDMSSIIPSGATVIALVATLANTATKKYIAIRKKGQANWLNRFVIRSQDSGTDNDINAVLSCASDRVFEYFTSDSTFLNITLTVMGWWI